MKKILNRKLLPLLLVFGMTAAYSVACAAIQQTVPFDEPLHDLILAAQGEGELNLIGVQSDWCNYGEAIKVFSAKYGIHVNKIEPEANSEKQIEWIRRDRGAQLPDVVDINIRFANRLVDENLVLPYKVLTWNTIPSRSKDENGNWYGGYFGVISFEVNHDVVENIPQDWGDLLDPAYAGKVGFAGDPRSYAEAQMAAYAAALANGGSLDDVEAGLDFFKQLDDTGNLNHMLANQMEVARGTTPIALRLDYNAFADKIAAAGNPDIEIVIPRSGTLASVNVLAISKNAGHPNAAKLWMEFLFSDEGQLIWLKDGCHPIRYTDMLARAVIPADIAVQLPAPQAYNDVVFPGISQTLAAQQSIADQWMAVVGVDFKK